MREHTKKRITEEGFAEVIELSKLSRDGKPVSHRWIADRTGYGKSTVGFMIAAGTIEKYRIDSNARCSKKVKDENPAVQTATVEPEEPVQIGIQDIGTTCDDPFALIISRLDAEIELLQYIKNMLIIKL